MTAPLWIELEGAVNARDLGGLPADGGLTTRPNRLLRSGNLQQLTPRDVETLVEGHQLRAVADLRTRVEVDSEGPGPLTRDRRVAIHHYSLFPEAGHTTDVVAAEEDGPIVLPWQERDASPEGRPGPLEVYRRYLVDRPDSIVAALRLIARTNGATLVHCAAGKDRTGVVVALALDEVGVDRDAIVADFVRSGEQLPQILSGLAARPTYAGDVGVMSADAHLPRPETMANLLAGLDEEYGGSGGWLRKQGWTDTDSEELRAALLW